MEVSILKDKIIIMPNANEELIVKEISNGDLVISNK